MQTDACYWSRFFLAIMAGCFLTLAFAPFSIWPLAYVSTTLLLYLLTTATPKYGGLLGYGFGLGLFATGASWVFVSIHQFGEAHTVTAILFTGLFIAYLACFYALLGTCFVRLKTNNTLACLVIFPCLWALCEWLRGWLFTGFPWLFLGTSTIDSPIAGFIPVIGVYGMSVMVCTIAGMCVLLLSTSCTRYRVTYLLTIACLFSIGYGLQSIAWTQPDQHIAHVAVIQANIPQDQKWQAAYGSTSLTRYKTLSAPYWQSSDIVIWPEVAITYALPYASPVLNFFANQAAHYGHSFITGIPQQVGNKYTNTLVAVGHEASGRYAKYHLVPFGEYVPLAHWLANFLALFHVPNTTMIGPYVGKLLHAAGFTISPAICYEIAYPNRLLQHAPLSNLLLTVSNDTWFGHSIGPKQHMQIARMRATELGRYLIRATNNGITAIVDQHGTVIDSAPPFRQAVLYAKVNGYTGFTPIMRIGHDKLLLLLASILTLCAGRVVWLRFCHRRYLIGAQHT